MPRFFTCLSRLAVVALLLSSGVLLSACQHTGSRHAVDIHKLASQFDVTVKAYRSGQFELDGALLSAVDLSSHFAYEKETGHLPKTLLLLRSDTSGIRPQHLEDMAQMMLDYGFVVYYVDHGTLKKIHPVRSTPARTAKAGPGN